MIRTKNFRRSGLALAALALLLGSTSCISQAQYDEAVAERNLLMRENQDYRSYMGELEAKNEQLAGQLALFEGRQEIEAGYTQDIDERMAELDRIASGIGAAPGDITIVPVEGGYGLRLKDSVLFDSGKSEVRAEGRALLIKTAKEIASRDFARIQVRGHTDNTPVKKPATLKRFPHGNLQLSTARAVEVAALLIAEGGIDSKRIIVAGFGANQPIASNDTAANKQLNRRVEIFVLEDEPDAED
jgi:chemotaxis protein MotB